MMRKIQIDNTLEALEALPDGAKLLSRHGHGLVRKGDMLCMEEGDDAFTLPFAHRYVLDENVNVLDAWVPDEIDAVGCIVYVTGDSAGMAHEFDRGEEVVIVMDDCLVDGTYYCESALGSYPYWVGSADLALEPPPVPLAPADSTCVGDLDGLDALPERSVVLCPETQRSWVRRGVYWVTVIGSKDPEALAEEAGDGVFYRSGLVVVLHHAQAV